MPVPSRHEVLGTPLTPPFPEGLDRLVVGMGCFWGAERIFWEAPGVFTTAVGYAGGLTPNPTYEEVCSGATGHAEVVLVVFDPARTSLEEMLRRFWEDHDPTQGMRQGNDVGTQYRSGIYVSAPTRSGRPPSARATPTGAAAGVGPRRDHHRDRRRRALLLRRVLPPAVPRQEPQRLLRARRHRRQLPGRPRRARPVSAEGLRLAEEKMRRAGVADAAIATFRHYYEQLEQGASGMLPEAELEPVRDIPDLADLPETRAPLEQAVVIKLNGGLGTSMGMTHAKSLVEVKDGLTFLDISARQVLELRREHGARLPLVLMDSFSTRADTLAALERYGELEADVPLDFLQNKEPKLRAEDLAPVEWPADPDAGMVPARPRRPLPGAPGVGHARAAARPPATATRSCPTPTTSARCSMPRILAWFAASGMPFGSGGRRPHARPTARAGTSPAGATTATSCCASPPSARRRRRGVPGHRPPALLQHEQPLARSAPPRRGARAARGRARPADDRQPQDRRPRGPLVAARVPDRDRHGRRHRRLRGRPGACAFHARASRRSRRRATCWCCAPTPTC